MKKSIVSTLLLVLVVTAGSVVAQENEEIIAPPVTPQTTETESVRNINPTREPRLVEERRTEFREKAKEAQMKRETIKQEIETKRTEAKANFETQKMDLKNNKEFVKTQMMNRLEEAKKAREERRNQMEAVRNETAQKRKEFVQNSLFQVVTNLESRAARIQTSIDRADTNGISTEAARAALDEANTSIQKAKESLETLKATSLSSDESRALITARGNAQAVHGHFKTAREALVKSIQELKKAIETTSVVAE
jgi:DNA repair exonuclease SbcCD ATPase subunit